MWFCPQWQAAVDCPSVAERRRLCERLFQGGEEELGLLEALKLLMLARALELHGRMQAEEDVPLFCWLLFARDSSDCPRSFLSNHLSHVGLSAGLEQVGSRPGSPRDAHRSRSTSPNVPPPVAAFCSLGVCWFQVPLE